MDSFHASCASHASSEEVDTAQNESSMTEAQSEILFISISLTIPYFGLVRWDEDGAGRPLHPRQTSVNTVGDRVIDKS